MGELWGRAALAERGTVTWLSSFCCSGWFMCRGPVTKACFGSEENESAWTAPVFFRLLGLGIPAGSARGVWWIWTVPIISSHTPSALDVSAC